MYIRIIRERLSDGSCVHNIELCRDNDVVTLHAVTLHDAQTFAEQLAALVKQHTVEQPRIGWGHGL